MDDITAPGALTRSGATESAGNERVEVKVGFIGLGRMGTAMAANLAAAGCRVVAYVRRPARSAELATLGVDAVTTMDDVLECDTVIPCCRTMPPSARSYSDPSSLLMVSPSGLRRVPFTSQ